MAEGFSNFDESLKKSKQNFNVKPIKATFGGSVPDSLYSSNRNSAWARWRRGMELATAHYNDNTYVYPFAFQIPVQAAVQPSGGGNAALLPGCFQGFPTANKELGMHWAGTILAGSLRFDNLSATSGQATISGEIPRDQTFLGEAQNNDEFWYIQLNANGSWSQANPLPPPLFVQFTIPGVPPIEPINGEILQDRIIESGGVPISLDTLNPASGIRYGFTEAVLADISPFEGVLKLKKAGSLEATIDGAYITPARNPPSSGRYFMNGPRYCCSCQDFTQRDYAYISTLLGEKKGYQFPVTNVAALKPGRYERVRAMMANVQPPQMAGLDDAAMDRRERRMEVVYPSGAYIGTESGVSDPNALLLPQAGRNNVPVSYPSGNRDFPGVFRDFGAQYLRNQGNNPNAISESMPKYADYDSVVDSSGLLIYNVTDTWTPLLDELRYCKHIYAMKYLATTPQKSGEYGTGRGTYPPEPSDYPVEMGSVIDWEKQLVDKTIKDQEKAAEKLNRYGLGYMDVPPLNMQSPMMYPMMAKLLNIPINFITMSGMIMYDKDGKAYRPMEDERPGSDGQNQGGF
jgi:hypothetical protein